MFWKTYKSDLLLLLAAFIWGTGFVAQRMGMEHVGPMTFNGLRFFLGGFVLLPILWHQHRDKKTGGQQGRNILPWSCLAGGILFCAASLQQIGLIYTPAGKAGFITGLYVIIVAFIGFFLGHKIGWSAWAGSILAVAGMYFLSVKESFVIEKGDLFILGSAVFWAVHVQMIGYFSKWTNSLSLACIQFFACAALSMGVAIFFEEISLETIRLASGSIIYGGVMSVGVAFSLQIISQKTCPPAHAAIIMSLEAVFAVLAGWVVLNESLSNKNLLGCGLMLTGIIAVQVKPLLQRPKNTKTS